MTPASAQNAFVKPGQEAAQAIDMKNLRAEAAANQQRYKSDSSQFEFDEDIPDKLMKVQKYNTEKEFNGDGVQFQVDMDKAPKFEYAKVTATLNDPAIRIGDNTSNSDIEGKILGKKGDLGSLIPLLAVVGAGGFAFTQFNKKSDSKPVETAKSVEPVKSEMEEPKVEEAPKTTV
eukprot:TRINITY_DN31984_c0_g1_i1.p1 TRINITY_DN31984_c0_g1~~TRINITY_DN31984_c0_g1_i1.p1  ORF type:complete len:175 (-),score=54.26 TRINITY_DN31984_c0_g1_i1:407-931(-)